MLEYMVVAMDNAKARFLTLQQAEVPEFMSGPNLVELEVLYNPEQRASDAVIFDSGRGGLRADARGVMHGYGDNRKRHRKEFERRFLDSVVTRLEYLSRSHHTDRLVLVAEARTLGRIRNSLGNRLHGHGVRVEELAENLSWLKPGKLHGRLADQFCLPARKPPEAHLH